MDLQLEIRETADTSQVFPGVYLDSAMDDLEALLADLGADDWETDGYGLDSLLICPHGHTIEQDGRCPEGCVSPLRAAGLI